MAKRDVSAAITSQNALSFAHRLRQALAKRTKGELIDVLVELAGDDRRVRRRLEARFELQVPPQVLAASTRHAIADATAFDPRDVNQNFDWDSEAYEAVQRNMALLVGQGHLRLAMALGLQLMDKGSRQVAMSDEGMMKDDVEVCLRIVLYAVKDSDLPARDVVEWCWELNWKDHVKFICEKERDELRQKFEARLRLER